MPPVIQIENLSKMYRLGQVGSGTLRDDLARTWARLRGKEDPFAKVGQVNKREEAGGDYVWALKDVNLEVEEGEILGIIGRNGAGKSTLLKLLSRVTAPTTGHIRTRGRIASLLEVGTGFHPELTGRENVYLNGALLGMSRSEVGRRLEEIVEFSGCSKYLDTPVKRYSSGMLVRLGFSVAAHLECEILIVDEVLAVGDADFQKKCIGKISSLAASSRTVLFVSHQLNMVSSLCSTVCVMSNGRIVQQGATADMLTEYVRSTSMLNSEVVLPTGISQAPEFIPTRLAAVNSNLAPLAAPIPNIDRLGLLLEGEIAAINPALKVGFAVYSSNGQLLFWALSTDKSEEQWPKLTIGTNTLVCWLPPGLLNNGTYHAHLIAAIHKTQWLMQPLVNSPAVSFQIDGPLSQSPLWQDCRPGLLAPSLEFDKIGAQPNDAVREQN